MAIELSNLTFTEQDDIVPPSGVEEIVNTGIANTLAGNDIITGTVDRYSIPIVIYGNDGERDRITAIYNDTGGIINTDDGNDIITGINQGLEGDVGIHSDGIYNQGTINTGDGNDIITGITQDLEGGVGIFNLPGSIINTGNGNDTIMGMGNVILSTGIAILDESTLDTGNGNDRISGEGSTGFANYSLTFNTGDGNDTITGTCTEYGRIGLLNEQFMNTGDGDDIITGINDLPGIYNNSGPGIQNGHSGIIDTGNGNDIITSIGVVFNIGIINTGNGADSIIADRGFIRFNNFEDKGSVFLENGKDYLKGFGSGDFNGGNGKDTLELTPGSYTVGISGTMVNFTKDSIRMKTSEFEKLIAGSTTYDFTSLTEGQTIVVA
jgi:hypothetical protein